MLCPRRRPAHAVERRSATEVRGATLARVSVRAAVLGGVRSAYLHAASVRPVRRRLAPHLDGLDRPFLYTPRGAGIEHTLSLARVRDRRVLVLGVGNGGELGDWLRLAPRHLVGTDLQPASTWSTTDPPGVSFLCADGASLALADRSVDVVTSRSVLEHVLDLGGFLDEAARVLSRDGIFHAVFGPLWHTFGGSHVTELGYDHLLLDGDAILAKARDVGHGWEHWLELDLFNRLRLDDYLAAIEHRFVVERLVIADSREGRRFRAEHPDQWKRLLAAHAERDLLVRLVSVVARRRSP